MGSIFSKIVSKEIPAHIVAEDERYLSFLDINPLVEGHTLVIPKVEVDYIFDLDEETFIGLHLFSKKVAAAIKQVIPCERVGTTVMGLEVPHAHIHLIPMITMDDMNFSRMKLNPGQERLAEIAKSISDAYKTI